MDKSYKYFIGVVQSGNISNASKKLRISQPALSASLKTLETHLKTELLVRSKKGVSLTGDGKYVYEQALKLQDIDKSIQRKLAEKRKSDYEINIGAIDSIAREIVPHIGEGGSLSQIIVDNSTRLVTKVHSGQLDAAYIAKPEYEIKSLKYRLVGEEKMVAITTKKKISGPLPLLAYNADSNTQKHISKALKKSGIKFKVVLHSTDPHTLIEAVRLGKGVAIVPDSLFVQTKDPKLVQVHKTLDLSRPIFEVSRKNRFSPDILKKIEQQIAKSLR